MKTRQHAIVQRPIGLATTINAEIRATQVTLSLAQVEVDRTILTIDAVQVTLSLAQVEVDGTILTIDADRVEVTTTTRETATRTSGETEDEIVMTA